MKRVYVMVAGPTDVAFLRRVLPPDALQEAEVVPAGDSGGMASLARSILVRRHRPVAVVMDSDSLAPDLIEERTQGTEELIRAANASVPVKVIALVPEIEVWFFASKETAERVVGGPVPPDWLAQGKRDPVGVLRRLAEANGANWDTREAIDKLDEEDIARIRALPEVAELSAFLREAQQEDRAA